MSQLTPLDTKEINAWLTRVTQTIDRSLREPLRSEQVASLRENVPTKVGLTMLTQMALLSDCLRVAHLAIEADGEIEPVEFVRVTDLVRLTAPKFFQLLPAYEEFEDPIESWSDVARFMQRHRTDAGPFGFADSSAWRGLALTRAVETSSRNAAPLREHETMLARVMDEVFAGRESSVEFDARRELRALFETPPDPGVDPRATAFCRNDGPEVFSSIAHGSEIHVRDLYDVEQIHAEARATFQSAIERASTPAQHAGHGRTLVVLGDSGAGKTHLLRALRAQTHLQGLGYVGYLQMSSDVGDYPRYVLRNLIDSLEQPYDAPTRQLSGLSYLSNGIVGGRVEIPPAEIENLRAAELSPAELDAVVGKIVDRIIRTEGLDGLDTDLLHALLLLQRQDNAIAKRVVKYLRCETLGSHDRSLLGGLASRDKQDDPLRTIKQLATIMYELQMAALVLLVDQLEDTNPAGATLARMQVAFDSLRAISDAVPSAVVVIACLTDVYDSVQKKLTSSLIDRLEHHSAPIRLSTQRDLQEIEAMLARRLEHLYTQLDAPWREDEPIYPFTSKHVEEAHHLRARDVLAKFREFQGRCISSGGIVDGPNPPAKIPPRAVIERTPPITSTPQATPTTPAPQAPPPVPTPPQPKANPELDRRWNDALSAEVDLPEDDDALLVLLEEGLRAACVDLGLTLEIQRVVGKSDHLIVRGPNLSRRTLTICNQASQGGRLGKQVECVRALAGGGIAYAVRTADWSSFGPKAAINRQIGELIAAGGRTIRLNDREQRAVIAMRELVQNAPNGLSEWRTNVRPLAQLAFVRDVFDLDRVVVAPVAPPPSAAPPPPTIPKDIPPIPTPKPVAAADENKVRLGATLTMRAEPILVPLEQVKTHFAFLGTTGSGKTTAALNVIEQLLERGVSVLMIDRKGDLAVYARESWWAEEPRRAALRAKIDIDLYTPGNSAGRPLRLPLVPILSDAAQTDRDQLAKFAAHGIGAMMGYGKAAAHNHKLSILQCAIQLHAGDRDVTLEAIADTINRPDPELLQLVGPLQRLFPQLAEDLHTLTVQRGSLIAGDGDVLDVAKIFPEKGARPRLTIINTAGIAEIPVLEFWMSRLLVELGRLARKRPSKTLQGAAFFDEADAYIPAIGAPPPKEPMFDLLRRARSAGIGMLLATQNPGDLDYKARELIGTWLLGKITGDTAINKMRNLLGPYPNVASRLATQPVGQFFALKDGTASEFKSDWSMMRTEQLGEHEVAEIARSRA